MQPSAADIRRGVAREYLLTDSTAEAYRKVLTDGVERVAARIAAVDRPFTGIAPDRLAQELATIDLDCALGDTAAALDELHDVYLRDAVYFHHPRYLAHLNCPVVIPAVLAEAVLSAINSSVDTWDQSAGATLIERRLIDWTARRLGFGQSADGVFTSGGSQSNLHALLLARQATLDTCSSDRTEVLPRLRILTSADGHFSVQKSAKLLGLAPDAVICVDVDAQRRMRPAALTHHLRKCRDQGLIVMAVVATAGTTDFGAIDPLPAIAQRCTDEGVWLHVDAAYGGGLLVSPTRRHLLDGIEHANSVTVDYHKSFFQPVSSSALVVADGRALQYAAHRADYLNPEWMARQRIPNQVDKSLQTTRRFDALKLWLTLRIMGADAIGTLFDEVIDRAAAAWDLLSEDPRFEVAARSMLSTVVFRYRPTGAGRVHADAANRHARQALAASGAAMIASTTVDGRNFLKFTLLNPQTTIDDVAAVIELIAHHADQYVQEVSAPLTPCTAL